MELHTLSPAKGSRKKVKRVGRGPGSGHGKTSGRGQKGQLSRSGGGKGSAFEGGQTPLQRRIPKLRGFKNPFKKVFNIVNLEKLNVFPAKTTIDPAQLKSKGLIKKETLPVKILGQGEIEKPLTIKAHAFSKTARQKIEKAGGKVELLP
jgi:large subunit ribosomal protein L15